MTSHFLGMLGEQLREAKEACGPKLPLEEQYKHYHSERQRLGNQQHPSENLNDRLIEAAATGCLRDITYLTQKGARADHVRRVEGVWGALKQDSAIHHILFRLLRRCARDPPVTELLEMLRVVMDAGASPIAQWIDRCWTGSTHIEVPLGTAAQLEGKVGEDIAKSVYGLLLRGKPDVNVEWSAAIHTMRFDGMKANRPLHAAIDADSPVAVQALLDAGANPNVTESYGGEGEGDRFQTTTPPLCAACIRFSPNKMKIVKALLAAKADPNAYQKTTAPERGVARGAVKVKSAGVWTGPRSETALHLALQHRELDLVKLLLEHSADASLLATIDGEQRTCKDLARGLAVEL